MKTLLRLLLKSQHWQKSSPQAQTEKGMTLIELLIGMVMAFLIITPMLAFVVDMLNTDRREQVKSNTEQDIQAAVDFIAQDLSQAVYIYDDNPALNGSSNPSPTGIPALLAGGFIPAPSATQTPILVFWKRQPIPNALPITPGEKPKDCATTQKLSGSGACNDTYVLALVAYYQVRDTDATWCQPQGTSCPSRIIRYQIQDGLRDPSSTDPDPSKRYFVKPDVKDGQELSSAFNAGSPTQTGFDLSKPTENVTKGAASFANPDVRSEVLVNYIDHSTTAPAVIGDECKTALGKPTALIGATQQEIPGDTLLITDGSTNSFYACVDTARNLARVTIRGNSLRRIQTNADYNANNSAYFPTATIQVQGLGARGN